MISYGIHRYCCCCVADRGVWGNMSIGTGLEAPGLRSDRNLAAQRSDSWESAPPQCILVVLPNGHVIVIIIWIIISIHHYVWYYLNKLYPEAAHPCGPAEGIHSRYLLASRGTFKHAQGCWSILKQFEAFWSIMKHSEALLLLSSRQILSADEHHFLK